MQPVRLSSPNRKGSCRSARLLQTPQPGAPFGPCSDRPPIMAAPQSSACYSMPHATYCTCKALSSRLQPPYFPSSKQAIGGYLRSTTEKGGALLQNTFFGLTTGVRAQYARFSTKMNWAKRGLKDEAGGSGCVISNLNAPARPLCAGFLAHGQISRQSQRAECASVCVSLLRHPFPARHSTRCTPNSTE